jgi:glycine/D-amino acid oxidase-like deaminating enzyme
VVGLSLVRQWWDTVIVGAGLTGALILDAVRDIRPDMSVLVLDRSSAASGATGRSAGVCLPLADTPGRAALVRSSHDYLMRQADRHGEKLIRSIDMWFVTSARSRDRLAARWIGRPLRTVPRAEVEQAAGVYPGLRIDRDEVVSASGGDCFAVDAGTLTRSLLDFHTGASGVAFWDMCPVAGLRELPDGAEVQLATGQTILARSVVFATGGWPLPSIDSGGVTTLWPAKRIVSLQVGHPVPPSTPVFDFLDDDLFLLPTPGGALTVSFRRTAWAGADDPLDLEMTAADISEGRESLARRSAHLADRVAGARAAYDGYPDSGEPVVSTMAGGRVVVAGGMGGSGVRLGPAVARMAASAVTGAMAARPAG